MGYDYNQSRIGPRDAPAIAWPDPYWIAVSRTCRLNTLPNAPHTHWPGPLDQVAVTLFFVLVIGVPAAGYVFLVLDLRAYWRSFRRQLIKLAGGYTGLPSWVLEENPRCLSALGLRLPCDEDEVKAAYRRRVKRLHPDRGGDQQQFLRLQGHFEQAVQVVRDYRALLDTRSRSAPEAKASREHQVRHG